MNRTSLLLLLAGVLGTGVAGALYLRSSGQIDALQAAQSRLAEENASLQRHAEELKALVKGAKTPALAPAATVITNSASAVELADLRRRLAESEERLARFENRRERPEGGENAPAEGEAPRPEAFAERMQQRMEEWRQRDPDGFARMQQSVEERRQEIDRSYQERMTFLSAVDTSGLSPEHQANHQLVLDKLKAHYETYTQISADPFNPANMERGREMYQGMRELDDALKKQREVLLHDLAHQAGYRDEKAKEFVGYLEQVERMTSLPRFRGGPGGGMFFGGGDRGRGGDRGGERGERGGGERGGS
jgi:hypothetical protein